MPPTRSASDITHIELLLEFHRSLIVHMEKIDQQIAVLMQMREEIIKLTFKAGDTEAHEILLRGTGTASGIIGEIIVIKQFVRRVERLLWLTLAGVVTAIGTFFSQIFVR